MFSMRIGALVQAPPELRSVGGRLHVDLSPRASVDMFRLPVYCDIDGSGQEAPTLRLRPGDDLLLTLKNELPLTTESVFGRCFFIRGRKRYAG
jgi:hypothetical protein